MSITIAELQDKIAELEKEKEHWKERAEWEYGKHAYPEDIGLAVGALDAHMVTWKWHNKEEAIKAAIAKYASYHIPKSTEQS